MLSDKQKKGKRMPVEQHPQYGEWKQALDSLVEVAEAYKAGKATHSELEKAYQKLDEIAVKIDA